MSLRVLWNRFKVDLRHLEIFEKSTKNDPEMTKVRVTCGEIVAIAKISELLVV